MDYDLLILSFDYILVFDVLLMDINNYYNKFIGIFIVLYLGIYVFIWIFYCVLGGFIYFQVVVNDIVFDSLYCNVVGV